MERKRWLIVALILLSIILGAVSCTPTSAKPALIPTSLPTPVPTPTPTHTPTPTPTPRPTSTSEPGQPVEVTNRVFFDYNGNGIQDNREPAIPDIKLTYQPGNVGCITGKDGSGTVRVPTGSYIILVEDPSDKFRYILTSETLDIDDGLSVDIDNNGEILIPLAQGFLTWPFPDGIEYEIIYYFQPDDPTISPLSVCEEGTWTTEKYSGLYIGQIQAGTQLIAPAPLTITDYQPRGGEGRFPGLPGGVLAVSYGDNRVGYFIYATLSSDLKVGDFVPRGEVFATTELCDRGSPHVHLFLIMSSLVVDPYDYLTEYKVPHHSG